MNKKINIKAVTRSIWPSWGWCAQFPLPHRETPVMKVLMVWMENRYRKLLILFFPSITLAFMFSIYTFHDWFRSSNMHTRQCLKLISIYLSLSPKYKDPRNLGLSNCLPYNILLSSVWFPFFCKILLIRHCYYYCLISQCLFSFTLMSVTSTDAFKRTWFFWRLFLLPEEQL